MAQPIIFMNETYFQTYLNALDQLNDPEGVLGEEYVIHPPNPDYGYDVTPKNALTFGCMGVDGVHYAILTKNGVVTDELPVIQVCPMDSDAYHVIGASFITFLADGCGVTLQEIQEVFISERNGKPSLVTFLQEHFDMSRLWNDERTSTLEPYLKYIEQKD